VIRVDCLVSLRCGPRGSCGYCIIEAPDRSLFEFLDLVYTIFTVSIRSDLDDIIDPPTDNEMTLTREGGIERHHGH
jgi:hypothetical protein